jgi:hypothetical protein
MNRILLLIGLTISLQLHAQTAVNFNCADCNGVVHNLFDELDNGNVVVLCWVMPCSSCIPGGLTCSNVCATYPANVRYYVADDVANTSCISLSGWVNSNNIHPDALFSNATISMTDYGSAGMPKVVVIGGASHTVFYNVNNTVDPNALQAAINQAMTVAAIGETEELPGELNVYTDPSSQTVVEFSAKVPSQVKMEIFSLQGKKVYEDKTMTVAGLNQVKFSTAEFPAATYLLRITGEYENAARNFVIVH